MQGLKSHAASDCPFNVWTDVESSATFTLGVPSSFRNCLGGMDGSALDTFGGEFEWDRYTVKFHKARGADHNVHIIYGKNLTDFKMEKSIENTITGVHPYWVDNETQAVMELPEKVVLQSKRSIPYQKITVLDCTSNFQEKPSEAALREYAQNYIDTTDLTEPEIDIKIDFLQLWNTPGYEDIVEAERVSLCDTVHALKMLDNLLDDSAEFETFQTQHYWDIISEKEAAGEEFIDIEDMYGYRPVSLERAVKCPHCGHEENVDLEDFMYDESSYEKENGMGPDLVYSFNSEDCYECPECGHTLKIEGWIREYPMGAYDSEDIKVEDCGG